MTPHQIANRIAMISPPAVHRAWERFRQSPLSTRLARGVFWSLVGAVIARGTGVIGSIVVARVLGISAFGEFTVIQSTVGLFGTFAGLGLGITATKYVAELRERDRVRCGRIISLILTAATLGGLLAGVLLFVFADWFAVRTLNAPQLAPLLRAGCALVLFSTLQGVYSGALGGFEAFKRVAHVNWIGAVLGTVPMVICTIFAGLPGAIWGSVLQMAIGCVIGHWALLKETAMAGVKVPWSADLNDLQVLWRFSLPAFLSSALVGPVNWACTTFLANQEHGYREVALLNAAGQWKNVLSFLPLMMSSVLVPILANLYSTGDPEAFRKLLRKNIVVNFGICLLFALPLVVFSPWIMEFYGKDFQSGTLVFVITIGGTALVAVNNLLSRAMQATGRAWLDFTFSAIWAAVLLFCCFLLVPSQKAAGLAWSNVIAALALGIWQWIMVRRLFVKDSPNIGAAPDITQVVVTK